MMGRMTEPRVVVVGSVNVDLVVRLPRLPHAGETAGGGVFAVHPGGKGGNQAVAAARLGADVILVAALGDDDYARQARADLEREGVDTRLVGTVPEATGVAVVLVDETAENLIALAPGANAALRPDAVTAALTGLPDGPAVVLAGLEVPLACVEAAAAVAADRGWTVVVNPAPAVPLPEPLLGRIDVLTPNEGELAVVAAAGAAALLDAGAGAVVVTRGAAGAVVHVGAGELVVPAPPVEAVDTTGAGDCFSGTLAWALGSGLELPDAVRLAVAAASLSARAPGARTGFPTRQELVAHLGPAGVPFR
jgi:ribokinase